MKLMIASDIHGSAYYCEKMIKRFYEEKADKLILLGDLLYHGPRNELPKEYDTKRVYELLNSIKDKILSVRGNCDSEVDQMVLEFPMMADYIYANFEGVNIFVTHGHLFDEKNPPLLNKGDILLYGHFHVPVVREYENFVHINPGSLSLPKEESPNSYMIFENKEFIWKNVENDEIFKTYKLK